MCIRDSVYTDWGLAERQVNGYSGAVHKKFQDRERAKKFVRDHRWASEDLHGESTDPSGSEESEEVSEEEGTGNS